MRVEFKESVAGANFAYRTKRVYDLPDRLAAEFIRTGKAVAVAVEPQALPAVLKPTRRRGAKRAEVQTGPSGERRLF